MSPHRRPGPHRLSFASRTAAKSNHPTPKFTLLVHWSFAAGRTRRLLRPPRANPPGSRLNPSNPTRARAGHSASHSARSCPGRKCPRRNLRRRNLHQSLAGTTGRSRNISRGIPALRTTPARFIIRRRSGPRHKCHRHLKCPRFKSRPNRHRREADLSEAIRVLPSRTSPARRNPKRGPATRGRPIRRGRNPVRNRRAGPCPRGAVRGEALIGSALSQRRQPFPVGSVSS
jgi:hypothetical protein